MPDSSLFARVDRLFASAERRIALLDRCRPVNAERETERVIEAWESRRTAIPDYRYMPPPDVSDLVEALEYVGARAASVGPFGELYAARALELVREARLIDALAGAAFRERAIERFPIDGGFDARTVDDQVARWIELPDPPSEPSVVSDDDRDPSSLVSTLRALVGSMRLPLRVVTTTGLACAAATGDGTIFVQLGVRHTRSRARRIALHEVLGHAAPRVRACKEPFGLFAVGSDRGTEDEEGRALLIEERHSLFDDARRRELAVRHLAARAVRAGADWVDTVRLAMRCGLSARAAVRLSARVFRGGGLAREIIYLPARERVRRALAAEPRIEQWLERGRIGVEAARTLAGLERATAVESFAVD